MYKNIPVLNSAAHILKKKKKMNVPNKKIKKKKNYGNNNTLINRRKSLNVYTSVKMSYAVKQQNEL